MLKKNLMIIVNSFSEPYGQTKETHSISKLKKMKTFPGVLDYWMDACITEMPR